MPEQACNPLAQPVFIATLLSGVIPYFFSLIWLYRKYAYSMSPRQKEIVWGGLVLHQENSHPETPLRLRFWIFTALLSALGFLGSWITMLSQICRNRSNDKSIRVEEQYVFAVIILLQSLFNVSVGVMLPLYRIIGLYLKIAGMGIILWTSVAAYVWLWQVTWNIFPNPNTHTEILWVLHVLNTCLIFHGVWWDGIFWWFTWSREMAREEHYSKLMLVADHATVEFLIGTNSRKKEQEVGGKNSDNNNKNNRVTDTHGNKSLPILFSEMHTYDDYFNPHHPLEKYCFDSLSYYPYFPYLFESKT